MSPCRSEAGLGADVKCREAAGRLLYRLCGRELQDYMGEGRGRVDVWTSRASEQQTGHGGAHAPTLHWLLQAVECQQRQLDRLLEIGRRRRCILPERQSAHGARRPRAGGSCESTPATLLRGGLEDLRFKGAANGTRPAVGRLHSRPASAQALRALRASQAQWVVSSSPIPAQAV